MILEAGVYGVGLRRCVSILLESARPRIVRGLLGWAEQELILPDGPFKGQRFRVSRQPVAGLWMRELDSGRWRRAFFTGPPQSGKTLTGYVAPLVWGLMEQEESCAVLLPDMNMARDKWTIDIRPVILAGRYRDQLPTTGTGSRGGAGVEEVHFKNGSVLKFMTGAAGPRGDAKRSGFTAPFVLGTEIEKMQAASAGSPETDPLTQGENRNRAYGDRGRAIFESTLTTEEGRTWDEICRGSGSNVAPLCPHCGTHVMLGRNNLVGWEDAGDEGEVLRTAAFACPSCGALWTETDRREALLGARLVHGVWCGSQKMDDEQRQQGRVFTMAEVDAPPPDTLTLGFRYSSADNLFRSAGDIALDEWRASRSANEEAAKRNVLQSVWALPTRGTATDMVDLDKRELAARQWDWRLGCVPPSVVKLTAFVDLGKRLLDYCVIAWLEDGRCGVCAYGEIQVRYVDLGVEEGIFTALHEFADLMEDGFPVGEAPAEEGAGGETGAAGVEREVPDLTLVDSGHWSDVAYRFCRERGSGYRPSKGYGLSQDMASRYTEPKSKVKTLVAKGPGYHVSREPLNQVDLVHINADHWKSYLFDALGKLVSERGALQLGRVDAPNQHLAFVNQLMSEKPVEEFIVGQGTRVVWIKHGRMNHKLDAAVGACVAGRLVGAPAFGLAAAPPPAKAAVDGGGAGQGLDTGFRGRGRPFVSRRER